MKKTCTKCGGPINDPAPTGRPKTYCSTACRRAAEREIRRLDGLIGKLEERASDVRLGYGLPLDGEAQALAAEIALQEARLAALLEAD